MPRCALTLASTLACGLLACGGGDARKGPAPEVAETAVKLDLPPPPDFQEPKPLADGSHTVTEMRLRSGKFVDQQVNKVTARKEFFRVKLQAVREAVASLGHEASWTLAAQCRDWKETQAIEREMARGTFDRAAWERRQIAEHDEAVAAQGSEAMEA